MPTNIQGLLGNTQNFLGQLGGVADAWENLQSSINPVTGREYDLTAPGVTTTETSDALGAQTAPLIPGILGAASNIYEAGRPDLNPLLQGAYNQAAPVAARQAAATGAGLNTIQGIATGSDPYTQQLAQRSATAAGAPFGSSFGSARHAAAANNAAANAVASRQLQAAQAIPAASQALGQAPATLSGYGQQYQDWQTGADYDWLNRYQDATRFGQNVPTTSTVIDAPSGADVYNADLARSLIEANAGAAGISVPGQPQYAPGVGGDLQQASDVIGGIGGIIDAGTGIWDTVSGWFAEGGEVPGYGDGGKVGYNVGGPVMPKKNVTWDDVL